MTRFDLGWLVGMLEGEGSFVSRKTTRGAWECTIQVASTDYSTIRRLREIVPGGRVHVLKRKRERGKKCWSWRLGVRAKVGAIIVKVFPHLGPRRQEQALLCLFVANRPDLRYTNGRVSSDDLRD